MTRRVTGSIWDFSVITSIRAGVMSTISLLVMMPISLPPCTTTRRRIFISRIFFAASVTFAEDSIVVGAFVIDFPAWTLLGSKSSAETLRTTSRSVIKPRGLPALSTTTTEPISFFFINFAAASTVSVSLIVMRGVDMTSSTLTSGALAFWGKYHPDWSPVEALRALRGDTSEGKKA